MDLYQELKEWQTGIGALVGALGGLIALMLAALWNFHLNRRRDSDLKQEEMLSVATALYGEIVQLRKQLALVAKVTSLYEARQERFPDFFADDYCPPEPTLYPALGHKLGLLPSDLVLAITKFHASLREVRDNLRMISPREGIKYNVLTALKPAMTGVNDIVPALRQIECLADLPRADHDLDLGPAEFVQDIAELEIQVHSAR